MIVYLGIGSNLGDRNNNIREAVRMINERDQISLIGQSTVIETNPYGNEDQPDFLNQVIKIDTTQIPQELLKSCREIEAELKREKVKKWGPRTIDIDILFYADLIIRENELEIPHPDLHNRLFVLRSMMELDPEFRHPVLRISIREIYNKLKESQKK